MFIALVVNLRQGGATGCRRRDHRATRKIWRFRRSRQVRNDASRRILQRQPERCAARSLNSCRHSRSASSPPVSSTARASARPLLATMALTAFIHLSDGDDQWPRHRRSGAKVEPRSPGFIGSILCQHTLIAHAAIMYRCRGKLMAVASLRPQAVFIACRRTTGRRGDHRGHFCASGAGHQSAGSFIADCHERS